MKQFGFLIFFIVILIAGYVLASPAPDSIATLFFGIGLIALATVGLKTLVQK
ncbi:MAG: hypothetical protein U9Q05_09870 [Thermodesulfobacteriota bacterium]|nr:hypothetical protein [Thermodesulfobacteriota bacterium]